MLAYLSSFDLAVWSMIIALQTVLALAIRRNELALRYPAFAAHIYFCACTSPLMVLVALLPRTEFYFWSYYVVFLTSCLLLLRTLKEIYRYTFGPAMALPVGTPRAVATWLAAAITACAMVVVLWHPKGVSTYQFYLGPVQAAAVTGLCTASWILRVYSASMRIMWPPWPARIWIGLVLSLTVNGTTMSFLGIGTKETASMVRVIGQLGQVASVLWWCLALWEKEPAPLVATRDQVGQFMSWHRETMAHLGRSPGIRNRN